MKNRPYCMGHTISKHNGYTILFKKICSYLLFLVPSYPRFRTNTTFSSLKPAFPVLNRNFQFSICIKILVMNIKSEIRTIWFLSCITNTFYSEIYMKNSTNPRISKLIRSPCPKSGNFRYSGIKCGPLGLTTE